MAAAAFFSSAKGAGRVGANAGTGESATEREERLRATMPWVEKYRPKKVDDIVHQEEIVRTLNKSLQTGNLPHFLFYGPPGTGKTSSALAIVQQLFGPDLKKARVCELNASDERGIGIVRGKIKTFSEGAVSKEKPVGYNYPCPPFKVIILDEADAMTADAQAALRRTMETSSGVTRFILICNYVSRIIEPLASRCAKFRFRSMTEDLVVEHLKKIAGLEKMGVSDDCLTAIAKVSGGDMRKAITFLQSVQLLYGATASPENVLEISGSVPADLSQQFLDLCKGKSADKVRQFVKQVVHMGYPASTVLLHFLRRVVASESGLSDQAKSLISIRVAEADQALLDGADEYLQMLDVAMYATTHVA